MYSYTKDHIPKSQSKRPGTKAQMDSITIHNTGNPSSTAKNERGWLTNPLNTRSASWHLVVDQMEVIEAIPLDEVAWHAGHNVGNRTSIGIEICESGDQIKVWNNAVLLTAKLLYERGWGINKVRTHQSWSGKNCPRLILPRWKDFLNDVEVKLTELKGTRNTTEKKEEDEISEWAKEAHSWVTDPSIKISDGLRPKDSVTREQVWTMMYRLYRLLKGER